jgi:hypothetical protein
MMLEILLGLIVAAAVGVIIGLAWHWIEIAYLRLKKGRRS